MRFADTSFWFALRHRDGVRSAEAAEAWRTWRGPVVTTNHVLGETWILLCRRAGHGVARQTVDVINASSRVEVVHCDTDLEAEAWRWLRRRDERQYSFVDATSFALMRRRRIREALAFDGEFAAAGFTEVRSS